MPRDVPHPLGLGGLADLSLQPNLIGQQWMDCDKVRVVDNGAGGHKALRAWPGYLRVGERLWNEALHGPAENAIYLMQFCECWVRKQGGHGVAAVDWNAATRGRILGIAHHATGIRGSEMVGKPRQTTGSGLFDLDSRGVFLGAEGRAYAIKITGTGSPNQFDWSNDGGATYSGSPANITGDWQAIEDGVEIKFESLTGHTLNNVFIIVTGGRPMYAAKMNRTGPHHYVAMAGGSSKILISNGVGPVLVSDGIEVREAGARAPVLKPIVNASISRSFDLGGTANGSLLWTKATPEITVARITADPAPPDSATAAVKITIPRSLERGKQDLAYRNVSGTIKDTVRRLKIKLYGDFEKDSIKGDSLSLVLAAGTALGGAKEEVSLDGKLFGRRWKQFDLSWKKREDFAYQSIGLRLRKGISKKLFTSEELSLVLSHIEIDGDGTTTGASRASGTFIEGSFNRFAITWGDPDVGWESGMSPFSSAIALDGEAAVIEASGQFPGAPTGLLNVPPARARAIHVYFMNSATPPDSRTGGPDARRLTPPRGIPIPDMEANTTVGTVTGTATAQGNLEALSAEPGAPSKTWTLTATGTPTVFSVSDGTLSYPNATVGVPYDNGRVRFTIRQTGAFTAGMIFTFATILATFADGKLYIDITDTLAAAEAESPYAPKHPFYNGQWPTVSHFITDGDRPIGMIVEGQAFEGGFVWTNGSYIIEPVDTGDPATQVVPDYWMQGRQIRRQGENKVYLIVAYIEPNGTYPRGALYIGGHFDEEEQELDEPYQGPDGEAVGVLLAEDRSIYWGNVLGDTGPDAENVSVLNQLEVMPDNDGIVGGGKVGEFVFVLGSEHLAIVRSRPDVLDDTPVSSDQAYMNPVTVPGIGMMAKRTWFTRPDGSAGWIGTKGQLFIASQDGAPSEHPVSQRLAAFLRGTGLLTETRSLRHSWAEYKTDGSNDYLYIGLISSRLPDLSLGITPGEPGFYSRTQETHAVQGRFNPRFPQTLFIDGQGGGWAGLIAIDVPSGQYATFQAKTTYNLKTDPWIENVLDGDPFEDADFLSGVDYAGAYFFHLILGGLDTAEAPGYSLIDTWNPTTKELTLKSPLPGRSVRMWGETPPSGLYNFWGLIAQPQDVLFTTIDFSKGEESFDDFIFIGSNPVKGMAGIEAVSDRDGYYENWRLVVMDGDSRGMNAIISRYDGVQRKAWLKTGGDTYWGGFPTGLDWWLDRPTRVALVRNSSEEIDGVAPTQPFEYIEGEACRSLISRYATDELATDFEFGLMVDLKRNLLYGATTCPWTAKGISPGSSCTAAGQLPGPVILGDRFGYLSIALEESWMSWGSPSSLFVFPALASDPGDESTFNIGTFYVGQSLGEFPTNPDGGSMLDGLMFGKLSADRRFEMKQIASNTAGQVGIVGTWERDPLPTDRGIVGPMLWMVQWAENRSSYPANLEWVEMDIHEETSPSAGGAQIDAMVFWDTLTAKKNEGQMGRDGTIRTTTVKTRKQIQAQEGFKPKPAAARASSYRMRVLQGQTGAVQVSNIVGTERIQSGERGR